MSRFLLFEAFLDYGLQSGCMLYGLVYWDWMRGRLIERVKSEMGKIYLKRSILSRNLHFIWLASNNVTLMRIFIDLNKSPIKDMMPSWCQLYIQVYIQIHNRACRLIKVRVPVQPHDDTALSRILQLSCIFVYQRWVRFLARSRILKIMKSSNYLLNNFESLIKLNRVNWGRNGNFLSCDCYSNEENGLGMGKIDWKKNIENWSWLDWRVLIERCIYCYIVLYNCLCMNVFIYNIHTFDVVDPRHTKSQECMSFRIDNWMTQFI